MSARQFEPITMGSPTYESVELDGFRVTDARFPPNLTLEPHVHERPCFAVVIEGSFDDLMCGRRYSCPAGTVVTEPAEERHANEFARAGAHVVVVEPDPSRQALLAPVWHVLDRPSALRDDGAGAIAWKLVAELRRRDDVSSLAIEGLVLEMLAWASRRRAEQARRSGSPPWLTRAEQLLRDRFNEQVSVSTVASEIGVHPIHLARVFRAHFGDSVGAFLRRLRIEWAAARLTASESSLAEIAAGAGFADQSHFTRTFKRHLGVTPGQFRSARR